MKRCSKCGRLLPEESFYANKNSLQSWCKDCFRERNSKMVKTKPRGQRLPPPTKESLYTCYVVNKMTEEETSSFLNISKFKVWYWLKKYGIQKRTVIESRNISIANGKKLPLKGRKRGPMPDSTKEKLREKALDRNKHKSGFRKDSNGYYEFTRGPHKGRLVHDVIMEEIIGRRLLPNEVVHHVNFIRTDNTPDNLLLMTRGEHASLHRKLIKLK